LLGDDAHGAPIQSGEADQDVLGPRRLDLEEPAVVDDPRDDIVHVVRSRRVVRDDRVQSFVHPVGRIIRRRARWFGKVVLRQVGEDPGSQLECGRLVGCRQVGDT
jgi:hypothetical protein